MLLPYYEAGKRYSLIKESEIHSASNILAYSFSNLEPMCVSLGLSERDLYILAKVFIEQSLADNLCVGCFDENDNIVGVLAARDLSNEIDFSDVPDSLMPIFSLLETLAETTPLWETLDQSHTAMSQRGIGVEIFMIGVSPSAWQQGIAGKLINAAEKHAKLQGYNYCVAEATSPITQHLFMKNGWVKSGEMAYSNFKLDDDFVFSAIRLKENNYSRTYSEEMVNGAVFFGTELN